LIDAVATRRRSEIARKGEPTVMALLLLLSLLLLQERVSL
jgi:hypothetical protein